MLWTSAPQGKGGRTDEMKHFLLMLLIALGPASAAQAIRCSPWNRLGPNQKAQEIYQLIDRGIDSSAARRYDLNPARVQDCLERSVRRIELDFDGACAQGGRTDMQALNRIFKHYAWSCLQ